MQHTIQHLFQVNSLEEVSRERLEELVTNYPSFSVGRYLLSRKLHAEQDGHFSEETQKTNLYFSNPFWLQWLLQNEEPVSARAALPDYGTPTVVEAPMTDGEEGNGVEPASGEIFFQEKLTVSEEAAPANPEVAEPELEASQAAVQTETEAPLTAPRTETEAPQTSVQTVTEDDIDPRVKELLEAVRGEHKEAGLPQTEASEPATVQEEAGQNAGLVQAGVEVEEYGDAIGVETKEDTGIAQTDVKENATTDSNQDREGRTRVTPRSIQVEEPGAEAELKAANVSTAPLTAAEALLQHLAEARGLRQALVKMNEGENGGLAEAERTDAGFRQTAAADNETQALAGAENGVQQAGRVENVTPQAGEVDNGSQTGEAENMAQQVAGVENGAQQTAAADEGPQTGGIESGAQSDGQTPSTPTQEPSTAVVAHAMALAEPVVEFEPYHTIDYFASVGIKFVQEENPSDKLGKQLKSFTDWLKVMRKLPQKNQEIVPDMAAEHQIQAIAAHSIKGKEIVTETMAEVFVKQGMREKAVDVYHKLSLLNPDKSAYFAAKIEQLKID